MVGLLSLLLVLPADRTLESSLAAARGLDRILLLEFGNAGCAPCKELRRALTASAAREEVQAFHIVEVSTDTDGGEALAARFQVRGNPTLLALGPTGKEVGRWIGFDGDVEPVIDWMREVPHRLLALDETVALADDSPRERELQLIAGRRLRAAGRRGDARPYLDRAVTSRRRDIAAAATWELALLEPGPAPAVRKRAAERVLETHPETSPAMRALEVLVETTRPPRTLIAGAIQAQARARRNVRSDLDRLVWIALRAGLPDVAEQTLAIFRVTLSPEIDALYAAELHLARGEVAEARARLDALKQRIPWRHLVADLESRIRRGRREAPARPLRESRYDPAARSWQTASTRLPSASSKNAP